MIHNLLRTLRTLTHDQRGNSLIAYAILLGGIALLIVAGMADFSVDLSNALDNQASSLEQTVQGSSLASTSATTTPNSPGTTTSGGGTNSGGGRGGRRGGR